MKTTNNNLVNFINDTGVVLVGLLSLGYCIFLRRFAEVHIILPYLSFPIFIGEIVLVICLTLFLLKHYFMRNKITFTSFFIGTSVYVLFILTKTLYGYCLWGALALRHAALFYYPLFAVLGYSFYRKGFFSKRMSLFLIVILMSTFFGIRFYDYDTFTCFILITILLNTFQRKEIKYVILPLFFLFGYNKLFLQGSRALLVSNLVSSLFIIAALPFILKIKKNYKLIVLPFLFFLLTMGFFKFADRNSLESMTNLNGTLKLYNTYESIICAKKSTFKMGKLANVKIYNSEDQNVVIEAAGEQEKKDTALINNKTSLTSLGEIRSIAKAETNSLNVSNTATQKTAYTNPEKEITFVKKEYVSTPIVHKKIRQLRPIDEVAGNTVFRIFIWEDMLTDIFKSKPIIGFDFGKPFRSINLEILDIGRGSWRNDGWIAAHNSYLEVIYRSGAMGILLILILFIILLKIIMRAIQLKSLTGVLLGAVLINWLIAANFMLILEMPYNAIPFWVLFGMTYAYSFKNN